MDPAPDATTTKPSSPSSAGADETAAVPPKKKVSDIVVTDANVAINVLAGFVTLAQQRGCYSLEESAKVWEAICMLESASKNVKTD